MDKLRIVRDDDEAADDNHRDEWLPLISDYVDEILSPDEAARLEAHLAGCPACTADLEGLRQVVGSLHRLLPVAPPRSFALTPAQARQLRPSPVYRFSLVAAGLAAAFLLCCLALDLFNVFSPQTTHPTVAQQTVLPTATPDPNVGTLAPKETRIAGGSNSGASANVTPAPKPTPSPTVTNSQPATNNEFPAVRWIELGLVVALIVLAAFAFSVRPRAPGRLKS